MHYTLCVHALHGTSTAIPDFTRSQRPFVDEKHGLHRKSGAVVGSLGLLERARLATSSPEIN